MKLLRTEQVGEILSFSPKKIRQMIMNGEIPSLKIGGEYRVKEEDLLTYINNQVVTA